MGDFHELRAWQKAHQLTLAIYKSTASFPREERFGLTSQIRRAAASIPANLAEGCGRNTDPELAHFCSIGLGSANELEYHLLLAKDLNFLAPADHQPLADRVAEIKRMLAKLRAKLKSDS